MASRISREIDPVQIIYDDDHWTLLSNLRSETLNILELISRITSEVITYGSVARGDVHEGSDIDILIKTPFPQYKLEFVLQNEGYNILRKKIVMATPNSPIKGIYELPNETSINFPLLEFSTRDLEFYDFGGSVNLQQLLAEIRVPGVTKELQLIIPNKQGHISKSILGLPKKELIKHGISQRILEERKRVLERRDKVGRTGVFLEEIVQHDSSFNTKLKEIRDRNPLVKKHFRRKS